ncbi:50S ribosomal protein L10 [Sneathiella chinensis]|uniref:Large ribosomal subunit protein uL10 n=1 Tax=Sneathiella chinensis TaxID=349750 RepID=A0ABQ5U1R0_9PROT|nr:50S ribosomal protein L10 [Sneathiella chinensis]GLQ06067.1 50S ribosomal protein L10 [Sneathiella chinensis]
MDRSQKEALVAEMNGLFNEANVVVVAQYSGLSVAEMTALRSKMRDAGANFKVTKNRLARLALEGTDYGSLSDKLKGPVGIAYSDDPVAAPKVVMEYAKANDKFVVIGGAMGATELDPEGVKSLASLPSLDELRGKLVGLVQAPATKIAGVLQAPAGQLARVLSAKAEQG